MNKNRQNTEGNRGAAQGDQTARGRHKEEKGKREMLGARGSGLTELAMCRDRSVCHTGCCGLLSPWTVSPLVVVVMSGCGLSRMELPSRTELPRGSARTLRPQP